MSSTVLRGARASYTGGIAVWNAKGKSMWMIGNVNQ